MVLAIPSPPRVWQRTILSPPFYGLLPFSHAIKWHFLYVFKDDNLTLSVNALKTGLTSNQQ